VAESIITKKPYPQRALKPIPTEKYCKGCDCTLPSSDFCLTRTVTSTGRESRKLQTLCNRCLRERCKNQYQPKPKKQPHPADCPKQCSRCKEVKPPKEFGIKLSAGPVKVLTLGSRCADCRRIQGREWVEKNPERAAELRRKSSAKNAPRWREYKAEYFQRNKERIRLRNIRFRRDNTELLRARYKAAIYRRRANGYDSRLADIKRSIEDCLESYRVGNLYWDVYDSRLIENPTVDHIVSVSRAGGNSSDNMTVTSLSSNSSKGSLPLLIWLVKRLNAKNIHSS